MAVNKNFVVKNGLEVNTKLILADANTDKVGIGSTAPRFELDVAGGIGATDFYLSGIGTFVNELNVGTDGSVLTVLGGAGSVGVGTALPAYLLDIRSATSTGTTALYVQGDVQITGDLSVDDITFDDASVNNLTVIEALNVTSPGISTFGGYVDINGSLNVSGVSTISVNSSSDALRITQTGSGNALVVEDPTNPDSTPVVINATGRVGIGTINPTNSRYDSAYTQLVVSGDATSLRNGITIDGYAIPGIAFQGRFIGTENSIKGYLKYNPFSVGTIQLDDLQRIGGRGFSIAPSQTTVVAITSSLLATSSNIDVGIGTTVTTAKLTVDGDINLTTGIITATSGIITYYGDGQYLDLTNNPSTGIGINAEGGLVGFGITYLHLKGAGISTTLYDVNSGIATIFLEGGGGSGTVSISSIAPSSPENGDLWYSIDYGRTFVYYDEVTLGIGSTAVWVDAAPFNIGVISLDDLTVGNLTVTNSTTVSNVIASGIVTVGNLTVTNSTTVSNVIASGIVTAVDFNSTSDQNLKTNIQTVDNALDIVNDLRGVSFDWKETGRPSYGVIAQELEQVLPALVSDGEIKTVNYNGIIGVLIEAVKELSEEVERLKNDK